MPRKKLPIDPIAVEGMAKFGASNYEIAAVLGCDEGTIRKRFSALLEKTRSERKIRLRELQWKAAENGSNAMLIWLGKQYLGQTEKVETKQTEIPTIKLQYSLDAPKIKHPIDK